MRVIVNSGGTNEAYVRANFTGPEKAILMPRDPELIALVNRWLKGELAAGEPDRLLKSYLDRDSRAE